MTIGIYTLSDPRTDEIRYVGLSICIESRYKQHCSTSNYTKGAYLVNWVNQLFSENLLPKLNIIEECSKTTLKHREKYWIQYYKSIGFRLVNISAGGEDFDCALSTRKKISDSLMGHEVKPETIEKIRKARALQILPPVTKEFELKLSIANRGKRKTDEHKRKLSEAGKIRDIHSTKKRPIKDNLGNIFPSIRQASIYHKVTERIIRKIASGKETLITPILFTYIGDE